MHRNGNVLLGMGPHKNGFQFCTQKAAISTSGDWKLREQDKWNWGQRKEDRVTGR